MAKTRARIVAASVVCLTLALELMASPPILEWDSVDDPALGGYRAYIGTASRSYDLTLDIGLQTSLPLTNLDAGTTYFLAVTAYDTNTLESDFSEELTYTPPVDGTNAVLLQCSFEISLNAIRLSFSGNLGQRCWVVASSDLRTWEQIYTVTLPITLPASVNVVVPDLPFTDLPMRFFRVVATAP